jgi:hypothetical protein
VRNWHTQPAPKGRGWSRVGYSDLILLDGTRHKFIKHDGDKWIEPEEISNGVAGINSQSRHLCYVGGLSQDGKKAENTLTERQELTLVSIISEVLSYCPTILIAGHNQFARKDCPSFFVPEWIKENKFLSVPSKNIYLQDPFNYGG